MRRGQSAHRPGHTHGQRTHRGTTRLELPTFVQEHVPLGSRRGLLAKVQERSFATHEAGHEAAATNVAGLGKGNGEDKRRRHGRINRIPTLRENLLRRCR